MRVVYKLYSMQLMVILALLEVEKRKITNQEIRAGSGKVVLSKLRIPCLTSQLQSIAELWGGK